MKKPYGGEKNGLISCLRTIEHFRQTRKWGCWNNKNTKDNCDAQDFCIYHPENSDEIGNKCDLRKGIIWKRENPSSPYAYGLHYIEVIRSELLEGNPMPLEPLLSVFYPGEDYDDEQVSRFKEEFHMQEEEMNLFTV